MLEVALFVSLSVAKTADLPPGAVLRLGDARWRAGEPIRRLRFSDDGGTLVAWVGRQTDNLRPFAWDAATGVPVTPPPRLTPPVLDGTTPAVPLKGDRILTAGPGDAGRVWDATTGRQLARLAGHAHPVFAVAASRGGRQLATGDAAGLVRLWDAATFRPLSEPRGHLTAVDRAELSPDGKRLLTWAWDGSIRVWDLTTGKELRAFAEVPPWIDKTTFVSQQPTFTPDGLAVVFGTEDRLVARDVFTGLEVPLPGGLAKLGPAVVVFAPDGKAVLTWENLGLTVWDWPSGRRRFRADAGRVDAPGFSPDGSVVFAAATVRPERWDARTGKELPTLRELEVADAAAVKLTLHPHPRLVVVPSATGLRVVAAGTGEPAPKYRIAHIPPEWTASQYGWPPRPWSAAPSPTGRQFARVPDRDTSRTLVYEAASGQVRRALEGHRGDVSVLGFTPDGTRLLTAGADHTVLVWDVRPQSMPLPEAVRRETSAAKLWATMCVGKADAAYLAMARLAAEPDAAVKTARMRVRAADKGTPDSPEQRLADARAVELLEALGTPAAREFLQELASGEAAATRTREAKRALERVGPNR